MDAALPALDAVVPQHVVIVETLVTERQRVDVMLDALRVVMVGKAGRQPIQQPDPQIGLRATALRRLW